MGFLFHAYLFQQGCVLPEQAIIFRIIFYYPGVSGKAIVPVTSTCIDTYRLTKSAPHQDFYDIVREQESFLYNKNMEH